MSKIALIWSAIAAGGTAATAGVLVATGVINVDHLLDRQTQPPAALVSPKTAQPADMADKSVKKTEVAKAQEPAASTPAATDKVSSTPAVPAAEKKPSFDVVRVEPTGDAVVAGQSEPGSIVALLSNGNVVGKTVADQSGAWSIVLDKPLKPGDHDISAAQVDEQEKPVVESDERVAVSVPKNESEDLIVVMNKPGEATKVLQKPEAVEVADAPKTDAPKAEEPKVAVVEAPKAEAPQAPAATETPPKQEQPAVATEETETVVAVAEPAAEPVAEEAAKPEQQPAAEAPTIVIKPAEKPATQPVETAKVETEPEVKPTVSVEAVETEKGKLFVAGAGTPDAKVRVYVEDKFVGAAETDSNGRWLLETTRQLDPGKHRVRADQVADETGKVLARAEVPFEREPDAIVLTPLKVASGGNAGDTGSVTLAQIPSVIIRKGDNLWRISRRRYGKGVRYTTIYSANKGQIRNPHLIYPGQVFMMPAGDVNWSTN